MNPTEDKISFLNASGCADPTVFEVLKREERERFGYRPLAYVCSPYAGDVAANVALARRICATALSRGRIPLAPHLLFPQFMDDTSLEQRELAMFMNRILLSKCDEMWIYTPHISPGMRQEASCARHLGTPLLLLNKDLQEMKP